VLSFIIVRPVKVAGRNGRKEKKKINLEEKRKFNDWLKHSLTRLSKY
jgi:hypothetical protein